MDRKHKLEKEYERMLNGLTDNEFKCRLQWLLDSLDNSDPTNAGSLPLAQNLSPSMIATNKAFDKLLANADTKANTIVFVLNHMMQNTRMRMVCERCKKPQMIPSVPKCDCGGYFKL